MIDHAPLLERAFEFTPSEGSQRIENIQGTVPEYIRGTYYLNGPARFGRGEVRYKHWLDGDGMVSRLNFSDAGVDFTHRFVRGTKYREEEEANRALYRTFGTRFDGDQLYRGVGLEPPLNVSVYPFAGTLLAFGEQGLPWELDPETLETRGPYTFGRRLNPISPFSAHPHIDSETGEMFNFGVSFSSHQPCVQIYRFTRDGEMVSRQRLPIDAPRSMHDFGLSAHHVVFYLSPYVLDMQALRQDGATIMEALRWQPELGSRLLIASRESGEAVAQIKIDTSYCLHLISCFESEGPDCKHHLTVDVIELERPIYDQYDIPELFTEVRRAQPRRYVVDLEGGELLATQQLNYRLMCDFPAVDPRIRDEDYRDFWVLGISATEKSGRKFFDQVVHCDWHKDQAKIYQAPPGHYLGGEPVFLPHPGKPRQGAVICQQFDAEHVRSSFLIFDAFHVEQGPVAELPLTSPIPLGFHASYLPA